MTALSRISCEEAARRLYEYLDDELAPDWHEKIRAHLEVCRRCYPHFNFERAFLDRIRSRGHPAEKSEELERRIRAALDELG